MKTSLPNMFLVFFTLLFISVKVNSQIVVDTKQNAEFYVKNVLIGAGVEVGNVKQYGMIGSLGQFDADPKIIGVKSGLVLSTGDADSVVGPNNSRGYTSVGTPPESKYNMAKLAKGDKDLNRLCRSKTIDISVIEFDFVPLKNVLEFNYVFASDEYKEFVGSHFNDVFGFFLSGPGIKKKVNLAVLPDKTTPISINTINHKMNKKYFRHNPITIGPLKKILKSKNKRHDMNTLKNYIQFDGLTTVLKVQWDVVPYQKYHIKIAIGDAGDSQYDSAIFLEAGSFVSVKDTNGKYFKKLETLTANPPNLDSIFGTNTIVEADSPVLIDEKFEITDIYFDQNSYLVPDSAKAQLDNLVVYLQKNGNYTCILYGYTDNVGSKNYNQTLSEKRAKGILDYLVEKGIDPFRIVYFGHNFTQPNADNSTEVGRAKNRRVEIIIED